MNVPPDGHHLSVVNVPRLHAALVDGLRAARRADGGFGLSDGGASELEPTAMAALALDDEAARRWLAGRQRPNGGFTELDGRQSGPATAALVALALDDPRAARRALRFAIARRGLPPPGGNGARRAGWGWTEDARSLVEPTARVLIAVRSLMPGAAATRQEALRLLRERQCSDGGWNYGNASHLDVDLLGYAQTTAIALIALGGERAAVVGPGLRFLRRTWRREPGALTTAQAAVAFRLSGERQEADDALGVLASAAGRPGFFAAPLSVAWATLATGEDARLEPFRGTR